ncbi:MAG: M23 family metallopeptidase [Xanthobacteraceae bacterium]|nr:M23 family metallopeptidase [Xanthobacteraceae bacterium]
MSHLSSLASHGSEPSHRQSHRHGHSPGRRPAAATPHRPHPANAYVIAHAGKQIRIGPVIFWIVVGTVSLLGVWTAATATYFTFRDDVLTSLLARQAEMQYSYEDRIAELRARIDRTTSRQLLDQEQFEQKLDQILQRQAALDQRTAALGDLPENVATGSVKPAGRSLTDRLFGRSKPAPLPEAGAAPGRQSSLKDRNVNDTLARVQKSLDRVEQRQMAVLTAAEGNYTTRIRRMNNLVSDLGLSRARLDVGKPHGGVGGPYVPVKPGALTGPFEQQLSRVSLSRAQYDQLSKTLAQVPYRTPILGEIELSSHFGVRSDPFMGRPAMHTGLDIRASTGDQVRATANGRVVSAGWAGGYGRMVEIDHGNGLSTRYGHMSRISVKVGDHIRIGQIVGEVGSTGRSTGPHLHYETRIDGEPVDPQRFLRAGARYAAAR